MPQQRRVFGRSFDEYDYEPTKQKKRGINIALVVFSSLVIVIGGVILFIMWNQQKEEATTQTPPPSAQEPVKQPQIPEEPEPIVEEPTPSQEPTPTDDWAVYEDELLGFTFKHPLTFFANPAENLSEPVRANVYIIPREYREPDSDRDTRLTVNRNTSGLDANGWLTRNLFTPDIVGTVNGFLVARYTPEDVPVLIAAQSAHGNLYFFYHPFGEIDEEFRAILNSFQFTQ